MTPQMTYGELATALERHAAERAAAAVAARDLAAELAILTRYDLIRHSLGHDYGGGQRRGELGRIEHALNPDLVSLAYAAAGIELPASMLKGAGDPFTPAELRAGFERVARPRIARLNREGYRHGTRASDRTIRGWERVTRWLEGLEAEARA